MRAESSNAQILELGPADIAVYFDRQCQRPVDETGCNQWAVVVDEHGALSRRQSRVIDPYLDYRGFFTELDHPDAGRHRHPGLPIHLSDTPGGQVRSAPQFGGHNRHVLESILQLNPQEIAAIEASQAMGTIPLEGA